MTTPFQAWQTEAMRLADEYAELTSNQNDDCCPAPRPTDAHVESTRASLSAHLLAVPMGEPVAHRARVDGLWFHAADKDGLCRALRVNLGCAPELIESLFTKPEGMA